jgi:hypothetical protein
MSPSGRWGTRKKHLVSLTDARRADPDARFAGPLALRQRNRVPVLLRADAGEAGADVADGLGISARTAAGGRERFAAGGRDAAPTDRPRSGGPAVLDGEAEAVPTGLACPPVPEGRTTWAARMLANERVERAVVGGASGDAVPRVVRKATSSRGGRRGGAPRRG